MDQVMGLALRANASAQARNGIAQDLHSGVRQFARWFLLIDMFRETAR